MAALLFNDGRWEVVTNSWTAGARSPDETEVQLHYQWQSGFGAEMSTSTVRIPCSMAQFLSALVSTERRDVVDLRSLQRPAR